MVDVQLIVAVVSIGFLVGVAAAVTYFAFAGPSRAHGATLDDEASGAD